MMRTTQQYTWDPRQSHPGSLIGGIGPAPGMGSAGGTGLLFGSHPSADLLGVDSTPGAHTLPLTTSVGGGGGGFSSAAASAAAAAAMAAASASVASPASSVPLQYLSMPSVSHTMPMHLQPEGYPTAMMPPSLSVGGTDPRSIFGESPPRMSYVPLASDPRVMVPQSSVTMSPMSSVPSVLAGMAGMTPSMTGMTGMSSMLKHRRLFGDTGSFTEKLRLEQVFRRGTSVALALRKHHGMDIGGELTGDALLRVSSLDLTVKRLFQGLFIEQKSLAKDIIQPPAVMLLEEINPKEACSAINEFVDRFVVAKHKIKKSRSGYFRGVCQKYWKENRARIKNHLLTRASSTNHGRRSRELSPLVAEALKVLFTPASGLTTALIDESVERKLLDLTEVQAIEALYEFCSAVMYRQERIRNLNAYLMSIIKKKVLSHGDTKNSLSAYHAAGMKYGMSHLDPRLFYPEMAGAPTPAISQLSDEFELIRLQPTPDARHSRMAAAAAAANAAASVRAPPPHVSLNRTYPDPAMSQPVGSVPLSWSSSAPLGLASSVPDSLPRPSSKIGTMLLPPHSLGLKSSTSSAGSSGMNDAGHHNAFDTSSSPSASTSVESLKKTPTLGAFTDDKFFDDSDSDRGSLGSAPNSGVKPKLQNFSLSGIAEEDPLLLSLMDSMGGKRPQFLVQKSCAEHPMHHAGVTDPSRPSLRTGPFSAPEAHRLHTAPEFHASFSGHGRSMTHTSSMTALDKEEFKKRSEEEHRNATESGFFFIAEQDNSTSESDCD